MGEGHDGGKDHGGGADHGGADEHRLGSGFKGVARAIVFFQVLLGLLEVRFETEGLLNVGLDARHGFDGGEFVDALGVVGDGAVAVHRDGDRAHAEEPEGDQTEGEDGGRQHQGAGHHGAHEVADAHEKKHGHTEPVGAEVARHEAGEDVERSPALPRAGDDLADVARIGGGEDLDELGNQRAGQGAATDDAGELPPQRTIAAERGDHHGADDVGQDDREDGSEPHQRGEGSFEVELVGVAEPGLGDGAVDEVAGGARDHHHDAHGEDPNQQLHLHDGVMHGQQDEGDQCRAGDAVGFKAVGGRSDGIARVIAGAIGDDAGIARVVFLDLEDDLHQVAADIGDLREDAAGAAEGGGAQRFADGEADEATAGQVARNEQQDAEHDQQFHGNQQHADAHAGLQRNFIAGERLSLEGGESGARVGEGVDTHAEGGHQEAAGYADHAERQNDGDFVRRQTQHETEVKNDDYRHEAFQDAQESALRSEVGFAGFVNQFANFAHGVVDRHVAKAGEDDEAENESEGADNETAHQEVASGNAAQESNRVEPRELEVDFTWRFLGHERRAERHQSDNCHQYAQD